MLNERTAEDQRVETIGSWLGKGTRFQKETQYVIFRARKLMTKKTLKYDPNKMQIWRKNDKKCPKKLQNIFVLN